MPLRFYEKSLIRLKSFLEASWRTGVNEIHNSTYIAVVESTFVVLVAVTLVVAVAAVDKVTVLVD